MSIERKMDKWYVKYPHGGMLLSTKINELEVHTSMLMMDPTNHERLRVWVLVGPFEGHFCSRFAEEPEEQAEEVRCQRPVHFSRPACCPGNRLKPLLAFL